MDCFFRILITSLVLNTALLIADPQSYIAYDQAAVAHAIDQEEDKLALELIRHGEDFDYHYTTEFIDYYMRNSFLDAIIDGDVQAVVKTLRSGCDLSKMKQFILRIAPNRTFRIEEEGALQVAIKSSPKSNEIVPLLLAGGIDKEEAFHLERRMCGSEEMCFERHERALPLAMKYWKPELMKLLLQDIEIESHVDQSPSTEVERNYWTGISEIYFRHPLLDAIKKNKLDLVEEMIKKGFSLKNVSQGVIRMNTHSSIYLGDLKPRVLKSESLKQDKVNIFEEEGVFQVAIKYAPDAYSVVKLLLENGVNPLEVNFPYFSREDFLKRNTKESHVNLIKLAINCQQHAVAKLLMQFQENQ